MTDTKTEHTYAVSAEDKEIIDWINDETKVSTAPAEREEVSIDWIKTDSDVSEAPKAEESDTLIDWINTDSNVSEAPKAEEDEVSIDWIDTDSDVLEASQTETAEIVGAEEDTSAKVEEVPVKAEESLVSEAEEQAFSTYDVLKGKNEQEIAEKKAKEAAEKELMDIYDAALVRMADGKSFEEALEDELDVYVAANYRFKRETATAKIMEMVAAEKERVKANRTISEESAKEIAAAIEQGKFNRESSKLDREFIGEEAEFGPILKIMENLRKGQSSNGLKDDQIIDYAVYLYLLDDKDYEQKSDEEKKAIRRTLAGKVAKLEEIKAIKNMEKAEAKESSSLLSKVVETVKKHKDVVIVACGVAVATLAAVSFLSPTGLLGLPVVALGPTSTKAVLAIAAFTLAAEHALKAGLRIINKLSDDFAKTAIEKEKALKAGREVLAKAKEKTAEKEVGKTAAPEKSVPVTRTVNVREALLADRLSQKVNG